MVRDAAVVSAAVFAAVGAISLIGACGAAKTKGYDCPTADQVRYGVTIKCGEQDISGSVVPSDLPLCGDDGQGECVATGNFRAVDASTLTSDMIRKGTVIAGVKGKLETETVVEFPDCTQDGQLQCVTGATFPAGNAAGASAKIVAGEILLGVSGTGVLEPPADCISNGQVGCLTVVDFPAIEQSKLAECISL